MATRIVWLIVAVFGVWQLSSFGQSNIDFFTAARKGNPWHGFDFPRDQLLSGNVIFPFLPIAGLMAIFLIRRQRWFWTAVYLGQLIIFAWVCYKGPGEIRPRRFLVFDYVNIVLCLMAWRELQGQTLLSRFERAIGLAIPAVLAVGAFAQTLFLFAYVRVPVRAQRHALPGIFSHIDYFPYYEGIDAIRTMGDLVVSGATLVSDYNLDAYPENSTDPQALIERLYLRLGHDVFMRRAYFLGDKAHRYYPLPIRPIDALSELTVASPGRELVFVDYVDPNQPIAEAARQEIRSKIDEQFILLPTEKGKSLDTLRFHFYRLARR
jgi:hypothetical protein